MHGGGVAGREIGLAQSDPIATPVDRRGYGTRLSSHSSPRVALMQPLELYGTV